MKKNRLNVLKTYNNIYMMHWGEAQTTLSAVAKWCLWSMIFVQILCNKQFFVNVYFKLEKTFSSHFKWTLVPRSFARWIKMIIKSRKDET